MRDKFNNIGALMSVDDWMEGLRNWLWAKHNRQMCDFIHRGQVQELEARRRSGDDHDSN